MQRSYVLMRTIVLFGYLVSCACLADGGGGTRNSYSVLYTSEWKHQATAEKVQAVVTFDSILVALNSVQGKYKIFTLRLSNQTDDVISLSSADDSFEVLGRDGHRVSAVLDVVAKSGLALESPDWDLKAILAYPRQIDAHEAIVIYVFVPLEGLPSTVDGFDFAIKSIGRTLELRRPPATAA